MDPNSGSSISHSQDQEAQKFVIDGHDGEVILATTKPLPDNYGDNRLVVMARDPLWFFAYWEATADRFDVLRNEVGGDAWQRGQCVLRAFDVTDTGGELAHAPSFDVPVAYDSRSAYVKVPQPGRSWIIELGFRFPDGSFRSLLRSNRISLPRGSVSNKTDSRWMIVNVNQWEQIFDAADHQTRGGSAELAKMMAQRWEFLRSVYSGSSRLSGSGVAVPANQEPGESK
jgi:hypothetical protein